MHDLRITLIQSLLHWENKEANLSMFAEKINLIEEETDIILLPEMFNTGFTTQSKTMAEKMNSQTMDWMGKIAGQKNAVITGSMIIEEDGHFYNRLIWIQPDGAYYHYDKRHLFRMMDEDQYYSGGKEQLIVEWKEWKICPMVCYDLRFPVWSRNRYEKGEHLYDCLLYLANWPEARIGAWDSLLVSRAIENQCYVAAVNRIGEDGNAIPFCGGTQAIDPKGELLYRAENDIETIETIIFSKSDLDDFREKFPVWMDADGFELLR